MLPDSLRPRMQNRWARFAVGLASFTLATVGGLLLASALHTAVFVSDATDGQPVALAAESSGADSASAHAAVPADAPSGSLAPAQPTALPTATPPPYPGPTSTPPSGPPTATPVGGGGGGGGVGGGAPVAEVNPRLPGRVPQPAIAAALASPGQVAGWMQLRNPGVAHHPVFNPYRTCLTLRNIAVAYHPLFNPLVFSAGCQ